MSGLHPMKGLLLVDSGEAFGLVSSPHSASYGGLLEIKEELTPETDPFLQELDAQAAEMDYDLDWQPVVPSNTSSTTQGCRTGADVEPNLNRNTGLVMVQGTELELRSESLAAASGSSGKRKAIEILNIDSILETSPNSLNVSATIPPQAKPDKRRRLDHPHRPQRDRDMPTESSSIQVMSNSESWLHNGDDLPVRNHIHLCSNSS